MRTIDVHSTTRIQTSNEVMRGVFNWMALGLGLTALTAYQVADSPTMLRLIFGNPIIFWGVILAELGLVFAVSGWVTRMSKGTASGLFLLYSLLNGVTMSVVLLAYSGALIAQTFFVAAAMFGAMGLYGYNTKRDLSSLGAFLFMGLVGVLIASLVQIFWQNPMMEFIISVVGVIVFTGLTAYDTNRIKELTYEVSDQGELATHRVKIIGALTLYLDFINLFLMLLRLFGGRSRD